MVRDRIIPSLLLRGTGMVKTRRFKNPVYLGEAINIVRIFNDKLVDELVILDISCRKAGGGPSFDLLAHIATECFMPLAYGGGIRGMSDIEKLFRSGFEKIILNTSAVESPELVREAARVFGSQAVIIAIDYRPRWLTRRLEVVTHSGERWTGLDPVDWARRCEELGAGEIFLTCVDREGEMTGYDLPTLRRASAAIGIPLIANGGAGTAAHLGQAVREGGASAAAAGSMFVFQGVHRAVLIHMPSPEELATAFPPASSSAMRQETTHAS